MVLSAGVTPGVGRLPDENEGGPVTTWNGNAVEMLTGRTFVGLSPYLPTVKKETQPWLYSFENPPVNTPREELSAVRREPAIATDYVLGTLRRS